MGKITIARIGNGFYVKTREKKAAPSIFTYPTKNAKQYAQRECLTCGQTISESAYSGKDGNFRKHVATHEGAAK